jgi:hypothetical protein
VLGEGVTVVIRPDSGSDVAEDRSYLGALG